MDTQRTLFFAAALQLLSRTAKSDMSTLGCTINRLAPEIEQYTIPQPCTLPFQEADIDLYALQLVPQDCPGSFIPIKTTGNGNCLYNTVSKLLCGNEKMASELRVRTGIALHQMTSIFLDENSVTVENFIKEQILLYAPFSTHDYNIGKANLSTQTIEMVLTHEIEDTFKDTCWAGMWQIQALSTALNMSILSVYPMYNVRIRHLFNKIVTPLLPYDQTIFVLPILWSGNTTSQGFQANHFVPLIDRTRVQSIQQITNATVPDKVLHKVDLDEMPKPSIHETHGNSPKKEKETHKFVKKNNTKLYQCIEYLPKHYCNVCEKLICAINAPVQSVSDKGKTYICTLCKRYTSKGDQSPLDRNKIQPGFTPPVLKLMSHVELNLVSLIHPYMNLLKLPVGGQYGQRGQSISIPIPIQQIHSALPVKETSLTQPYMIITTPRKPQKEHKINYRNVYNALEWLVQNNVHYKDVEIKKPLTLHSDTNTVPSENQFQHETQITAEQMKVSSKDSKTDEPNSPKNETKVTAEEMKVSSKDSKTDEPNSPKNETKVTAEEMKVSSKDSNTDEPNSQKNDRQVTADEMKESSKDSKTDEPNSPKNDTKYAEAQSFPIDNTNQDTNVVDKPANATTNDKVSPLQNNTSEENTKSSVIDYTQDDVQHLSLIPTDYVIPKTKKQSNTVPKHDLPYFKTKPINIFEHSCAEEMAFPNLFPYGINGFRSVQPKTTFQQYISCRMLNSDLRWAKNIPYIFWALNVHEQHCLQSSISVALRINPQQERPLQAEHILQQQYTQFVSEDFRFMKQIKGTASYWREQLHDLLAKINILGPPTFFLSLSSNDSNWTELYQFIDPSLSEEELKALTVTVKAQMLRENPVRSALYFSKRWETFLRKIILGPKQPLGEIVDHFARIEFQNRGSPHVHAFLWVKNAPNMETIEGRTAGIPFIDKYIKAQLPKEEDPLFPLVKTLQTHNHTHTCYKTKNKSQCRFDFPRQTSTSTQIQLSNISSTTGRFYKLARDKNSEWINPYNSDILAEWNANMDIQMVGCKYAAAAYVCTYVCKNEPENLKIALSKKIQTLPENASLRKRLSRIGNVLLTHRVISAQEAVFRLLNLHLVYSSRETIYINSNPEHKRFRMLKPKNALEKLPADSTQIFVQNIHDIYSRRPSTEEFNSMCLAHFATHFVKLSPTEKVEPTKSKLCRYLLQGTPQQYVRERQKPACFRTYIPKITESVEDHYHALLCLFLPWRNAADIKSPFKSYKEAFSNKLHLLQKSGLEQLNYTEKLLAAIQQIRLLEEEQQNNVYCNITPAFMQEKADTNMEPEPINSLFTFSEEAQSQDTNDNSTYSSAAFKNLAQYTMTDSEYDASIKSCNEKQRHILSLIDKYILEDSSTMTEQDKLRLFITGGAGCGKSFLLKLIREHLLRTNKTSYPNVIVTAPTGVAAYNVKGWTLHKMLHLNVQHKKEAEYTPLSAKQLNRLRLLFIHVKVLIIDEISMVSIKTLLHIHKRLSEIKDTLQDPDTFFGGLHVLTFGDLFQLRPVYGRSVYKDHDTMCGTHLWRDLFFCEELTENVRQMADPHYANLLNRIRTGSQTPADICLLQTKVCKDTNNSPIQHIFPTKEQCQIHNTKQLEFRTSMQNPMHDIYAIDDPADEDIPDDDTFCGGLPKKLSLCKNSKVMLLRNIETEKGLVNGAQGRVVNIHYSQSDKERSGMPTSIEVLFDNPEIGGVFTENKHQPIHIKPITVTFYTPTRKIVTRTQFPLNVSFAVTVHKVQGLTLREAAVSIGQETFNAGMAYVALSRISTLEGLTVLDICPSKIYASKSVKAEMVRLRSKKLQL